MTNQRAFHLNYSWQVSFPDKRPNPFSKHTFELFTPRSKFLFVLSQIHFVILSIVELIYLFFFRFFFFIMIKSVLNQFPPNLMDTTVAHLLPNMLTVSMVCVHKSLLLLMQALKLCMDYYMDPNVYCAIPCVSTFKRTCGLW